MNSLLTLPVFFRRTCLFVSAVLVGAQSLLAAERVQVTLLSTTDLHGRLYPLDYFNNKPAELGLAKVATLIKQARKENPNTLLLDCGDTIQGTPLAYFHARKNNAPADPMMTAMNALGFVSMTPGNHEYDFGLNVLNKARGEAKFPWLSANTYRVGTNETAFQPYIIQEVAGVRIGILGLTTPSIPNWANAENYAGLEFRPLIAEAQKWVPVLREKEKVDLVVVAGHFGVEEDMVTGKIFSNDFPGENAGLGLARAVPDIDVLFLAHTHREISSLIVNGVQIVQAGRWGDHLGRVDVTLERASTGAWAPIAMAARTIPVETSTKADEDILALAKPYHEETQAWLGREVGRTARTLKTTDGHLVDNALIDLVHRAQLEAGDADVSFAANFNVRASLVAGPVTVRDISSLYIYDNTLYVLELSGADVKAALEHAARFFLPFEEGKTPADLLDRSIPLYGYDMAEGVSYEIDLRAPVGSRIKNLTFRGQPLAADQKLKVATNNYRYNGGGGYTMFKGAKVIKHTGLEIRDIILDWVEKHGEIPATPSENWRLVY